MSTSAAIALGEHFSDFVADQVRTGRYGSVSEVVQAGLRLLEEQHGRVQALQAALIAGETSGDAMPFDSIAFLAEMRAKYAS